MCLFILEILLAKETLLTTIPWMSAEWIISFTLTLTSLSDDCNLVQFTTGGDYGVVGGRIPAIFINKHQGTVDMVYINSVSGKNRAVRSFIPPINVETQIEMHQRYVSSGNYRFFIVVNGEEINSVFSTARQFYNVKVYSSNPWHNTCPGYIKNFKFTNFL